MNQDIRSILERIEESGFEAYVIGGYVRDKILNIDSVDIDIATSATPKDLMKIFKVPMNHFIEYGNVKINTNKYRFDITTFRKELSYNGRKPETIEYVDSLEEDIKRRDFTINTIAMNSNGELIDLANGVNDLYNKEIKSVGDANYKLKEDPLRILRALRFAIILDFKLDKELFKAIKKNMKLVRTLPLTRVKEELDKILVSNNCVKGLGLMKKIGILRHLGIKFKHIVDVDDINGMYAQLKVSDNYPFTKEEKNNINTIKNIVSSGKIDNITLYRNGLYLCMVASKILNKDIESVTYMYNNLPIKSKKDLSIGFNEIKSVFNISDPKLVVSIMDELELKILNNEIENTKDSITAYIVNRFGSE